MSTVFIKKVDSASSYCYNSLGDIMSLCDELLKKLALSDKPISGERLAGELGVSRNAVWKAVNSLRGQGYSISAATNSGYILASDNQRLCAELLNSRLKGCRAIVLDEVGSTNAVIKEMAEQGAPEGTLAFARKQYSGRGRLGRSFLSPEGGLYFSLLLRPRFSPELAVLATAAAAVAVCRGLEKNGSETCKIKWVNDVYIKDRKVCGILTEGAFDAESTGLKYAVVGIGINITEPESGFAPEIADRAAAVFGKATVSAEKLADIAAAVINELMELYSELEAKSFMEEYRSRSWLRGRRVFYEKNGEKCSGTVLDIDENARLLLESDGRVTALSAGEVSVKAE